MLRNIMAYLTNAGVPLAVPFVAMQAVHFIPHETLNAHCGNVEPNWTLDFRATDETWHDTDTAG